MTLTIDQKFSIEMAELLFKMRVKDINNTMIINDDFEQIPVDFIDSILADPIHIAEIKSKIGYVILEAVLLSPDKFKDNNGKYQYISELYDNAYMVDGYLEEQYAKTRNKTTYLCMHCNSDNVRIKAWVKPNQGNLFISEVNQNEMGWCDDCNQVAIVETASLKHDAKVIGFQVVGEDGTPEEGEIHPHMDASFCVYSLEQARAMMDDDNNGDESWRLLSVWEGDIEEPTMMFEGDPRTPDEMILA